jgi:hypothetical protein
MKKFALAALVAVFLFGSVNTASAMDDKAVWAQGFINVYFQWLNNSDFEKKDAEDDFIAAQRTRMYVDYMSGENLTGVVRFEIDNNWGDGASGGGAGADGIRVEVKNSFIKWTVPDTDLVMTMGIQGVALPSATYGQPVLNNDVAAVVASNKFSDMFTATLFWARLGDTRGNGETLFSSATKSDVTSNPGNADEYDAVGLILPIAFDGGTITPWGVWTTQGKDAAGTTKKSTGQWIGGALKVTAFDPISLGLDVMHGKVSTTPDTSDANGWFAAADVTYKMDMLTASLVGFTSSGNDSSTTDGTEVMPVISNGNGAFAPTTFGTYGDWNMGSSNILTEGPGAQGIGIKLTNLSSMENLTHEINVFYFKGTSKKDAAASLSGGWSNTAVFTKDDSAWEVNFESVYSIYENLSAVLDLSMVDANFSKTAGARTTATSTGASETAYKGAFQIQYNF